MSSQRLFQILHILLDKEFVPAKDLAQRFEVSIRTIYRDVEALSFAGIPVYTSQGKNGGIGLLNSYILSKSFFSEKEQDHILLALKNLGIHSNEITILQEKLKALFKKQEKDWLEVDFSRWGSSKDDQEKFETLKKSIIEKQIIHFTYSTAYGEKSEKKVKPLKLVFKSKAWYLQAFCLAKNDFRTFKLNRIYSILPTNQFFSENYNTPPIQEFTSNYPYTPIKLRFHKLIANRVFEEFHHATISYDPDGHLIVSTSLPEDPWLYSFILSFGSSCQVLEPTHIHKNILLEIKKMLTQFS